MYSYLIPGIQYTIYNKSTRINKNINSEMPDEYDDGWGSKGKERRRNKKIKKKHGEWRMGSPNVCIHDPRKRWSRKWSVCPVAISGARTTTFGFSLLYFFIHSFFYIVVVVVFCFWLTCILQVGNKLQIHLPRKPSFRATPTTPPRPTHSINSIN